MAVTWEGMDTWVIRLQEANRPLEMVVIPCGREGRAESCVFEKAFFPKDRSPCGRTISVSPEFANALSSMEVTWEGMDTWVIRLQEANRPLEMVLMAGGREGSWESGVFAKA